MRLYIAEFFEVKSLFYPKILIFAVYSDYNFILLTMKRLNLCAAITALIMITMSCGGTRSSEANDTGDDSATSAVSNGVEIVYSSADAINAPSYDPDAEWGSPLALGSQLSGSMAGFPIVESGAYPDGDRMVYGILLVNHSPDTVTVSSIKLPDSSMTVDWHGSKTYRPGVMSIFKLVCDSVIWHDDYRFILTYEGDKYPAQVFHVNLRPDLFKMMEELKSRNK